MAAVSDSSPLILYAKIGRLELIEAVFEEVYIPEAVRSEILFDDAKRPGAAVLMRAPWVRIRRVSASATLQPLLTIVDRGEAEAIALVIELDRNLPLVIDDLGGRILARRLGLRVTGSGGLLVLAKERGIIPRVRPILDELRSADLYLSAAAYQTILSLAGE